jgi:hypothetical protein
MIDLRFSGLLIRVPEHMLKQWAPPCGHAYCAYFCAYVLEPWQEHLLRWEGISVNDGCCL